jgi:hypothetical protein
MLFFRQDIFHFRQEMKSIRAVYFSFRMDT